MRKLTPATLRALLAADVPHLDPVVVEGTVRTKTALVDRGLAEDCGGTLIRLTNKGRAEAGKHREGADKRPRLLSYEGFTPHFSQNYGPPESWQLLGGPSAFNNHVRVKRYRITIEAIVEDDDVIFERLEQLMCDTDNHHNKMAIKGYARSVLGRDLTLK